MIFFIFVEIRGKKWRFVHDWSRIFFGSQIRKISCVSVYTVLKTTTIKPFLQNELFYFFSSSVSLKLSQYLISYSYKYIFWFAYIKKSVVGRLLWSHKMWNTFVFFLTISLWLTEKVLFYFFIFFCVQSNLKKENIVHTHTLLFIKLSYSYYSAAAASFILIVLSVINVKDLYIWQRRWKERKGKSLIIMYKKISFTKLSLFLALFWHT